MSKCCGPSPCNCRVTAGPGVTVDGNGSPATPYVVSADSATPTPVQAADTPTVDATVAGTGTAADPYVISADVILDPTPPAGGTNLAHAGPDGLFVECADVRGCITAGDGIAYDPATGEIDARPSTDAGNLVTFGTDGGLLAVAPAVAPTVVQAGDTPTANNTVTGTGAAADPYVVTTDVIVDPAPPAGGSNLLQAGPDGLYVECADVRGCLTAGDGIAYDSTTGEISARVSGDAGNVTTIGGDGGIYTPAASTALQAADTTSVDVTVTGNGAAGTPYEVSAAVRLDATPPGGGSNLIEEGPDGLYVECADVRGCLTAGDGIAYDPATGEIDARPSTDAGNIVTFGTDGGLYATGGGGAPSVVTAGDSTTANNTVTGTGAAADPYVVTTDVIVDPAPPAGGSNLLQAGPDGLYVECADVRGCLTAGDGIAYDSTTGEISARVSGDAGNTTVIGGDGGIYTPAAATALQAADTPSVDVTVTGTGAAGTPYQVAAAVRLDATPPGGGSNLIEEGPDGLYVECADVRSCITAGDGAAYTAATGEVEARLSTNAGNTVVFGTDGGLFVPPDAPLEIGCGLQGAGTAASPLAAFPVAGSQAWSADWACAPATHSTLKCDPSDGTLWTPPEHYSAAESIYVEHFLGGWATPITATGGWVIISPGANWQFNFPANFLGNDCRGWTYDACIAGTWDINYTSTAVFEVGYVYSWNGGPATVRPLWGLLTAPATARRHRDNGTMHEFGFNMDPLAPHSLVGWPAVRVVAGSLTINSWITDGAYHTTTMHN